MENRKRLIELLTAVRYTTNDIEKVADEICLLFDVVGRSEQFNCFLEDSEQGERCETKCKDCKDYEGVSN
jgi:hypothetical protein